MILHHAISVFYILPILLDSRFSSLSYKYHINHVDTVTGVYTILPLHFYRFQHLPMLFSEFLDSPPRVV